MHSNNAAAAVPIKTVDMVLAAYDRTRGHWTTHSYQCRVHVSSSVFHNSNCATHKTSSAFNPFMNDLVCCLQPVSGGGKAENASVVT